MKRIAVLLLVTGCVGMIRVPSSPDATKEMDLVRSQEGACADAYVSESPVISSTNIKSCARIGAPFTTSDNNTPYLITHLTGPTFPDADPSNWIVTVTGPDGRELLHEAGQAGVGEVGTCSQYGCEKWNVYLLHIDSPWTAGTYRIRYVCSFDTRRFADLSLTLVGQMSPNIVAAIPVGRRPWVDEEKRAFRERCNRDSRTVYASSRTSTQIEYGCECLTNGVASRMSVEEMSSLIKKDQSLFQKLVNDVNAECKKRWPPEAGPVPN